MRERLESELRGAQEGLAKATAKGNSLEEELSQSTAVRDKLIAKIQDKKAKAQQKKATLREGEATLARLQADLQAQARATVDAERARDENEKQARLERSRGDELQAKLDEAQKSLVSSSQMIAWLNKSLTDKRASVSVFETASLAHAVNSSGAAAPSGLTRGAGSSSVFSFKPSYSRNATALGATSSPIPYRYGSIENLEAVREEPGESHSRVYELPLARKTVADINTTS